MKDLIPLKPDNWIPSLLTSTQKDQAKKEAEDKQFEIERGEVKNTVLLITCLLKQDMNIRVQQECVGHNYLMAVSHELT
jgi:hypothetical protein